MLKISEGKVDRPEKLVIYGPEGIGKSTLASMAPNPLFIDTEGGTSHLNIRRLDRPANWEDLLSTVKEVASTDGICGTLILDTADWAEQMCSEGLCKKFRKTGIEEFGFGKGYVYLAEEFGRLLRAFDECIKGGTNVIVTAHAKMRKFEQPDEMGAYDRWEMKLSKQVAPLLKEWSDDLLFLNYKTFVVTAENDTRKVQGGKRVIYATHHPCWDAKNRHGLPDEMDLDFGNIASLFNNGKTEAKKTEPVPGGMAILAEAMSGDHTKSGESEHLQALKKLMLMDHVDDEEIRKVVAMKKHFKFEVPIEKYPDKFIAEWILPNWRKIVDVIEADPNRLPF